MRGGGALLGLTIAAVLALASAAGAQSPDDVLLDDVGPGWERTDCRPTTPSDSASVCFTASSDARFLEITANLVPAGIDPRTLADQLAASYAGTPTFPTTGLDAAHGFTLSAAGADAYTLVLAGSRHVFNIGFIPNQPPAPAIAFLIDVGRRQQQRDGGPPPVSTAPVDATESDALERLLVSLPPSSGFVEVDTTTQRQTHDELRAVARNQRVIDLLNDEPVTTRIFRSTANSILVVSVTEHPYDEFAATELGAFETAHGLVGVHDLPGVRDGLAFGLGADQQGAAFRRGSYSVMVVLAAPGADASDIGRVVAQIAALQAERLPPGPTGPYTFPSLGQSLVLALALTTLVSLTAVGASRVGALRRRRAAAFAPSATAHRPAPGDAVDVDGPAAVLRRRGYVVLAIQIVAVDAVVVGVLIALGAIDLPQWQGLALATIGLVGALIVTGVAGRRELAAFGGGGAPRRGRWRTPLGAAAGVAAFGVLVAGVTLAAGGLADLVFGPSIGGLERAAALHIAPSDLRTITLVVGLVLLVVGGVAVRLARMWSRSNATRLRQLDRRPPIVYLRSFKDDALPLPTVVSARRPFLELFAPRASDPFEEAVAWELAPYGPVVAIGRPGRSLASLGAARDHLSDDEWRDGVTGWMAAARAVVMAIGSTRGVQWEIATLATHGHLDKTVFLFPPTDVVTHQERWRFTARALRDAGMLVPPLPGDPDRALTAVLDAHGQWHVATATVRDEATYRVAVDMAMAAVAPPTEAAPSTV